MNAFGKEFRKGYRKALRESFELLGVLLNEGIDIRAFSRLSDEEDFQKACAVFKDRIQSDKDAREYAKLQDLNAYKKDFEGFIEAVERAVEFIENRAKSKGSRKGQKIEGVDIVYEDERFFISSPESYKYSHKAAYLDGGKANWCIALRPSEAKKHWENYHAKAVFYIFFKGDRNRAKDSWAMLLSNYDVFALLKGFTRSQRAFTEIETRANTVGSNPSTQLKVFRNMLSIIGKTPQEFYSILKEHLQKYEGDYQDYKGLLFEGARQNDVKTIDYALKMGADINCTRKEVYGARVFSPLFDAIRSDSLLAAKFLVRHGADVNWASPSSGETALHYAAQRYGNESFIEMLIKNGAKIEAKTKDKSTPLMDACFEGLQKNAEVLLKHGASTKGALQRCRFPKLKICKTLLDAGADINERDDKGQTPLYAACMGDNYDVAKFLIEHGADLNKTSLLKDGREMVPLCRANEDISKLLIENGADVNGSEGNPPLFYHVHCYDYGTVKYLLEKGANPNAFDRCGLAPLHKAAGVEALGFVQLLIKAGADVNLIDKTPLKNTPIQYTTSVPIREALLDAGAIDKEVNR